MSVSMRHLPKLNNEVKFNYIPEYEVIDDHKDDDQQAKFNVSEQTLQISLAGEMRIENPLLLKHQPTNSRKPD